MDSGRGKAKHRKRNDLYIGTYRIRTLRTQEHLEELEEELTNIKWDVVGICKTLPGEKSTILHSEHVLY